MTAYNGRWFPKVAVSRISRTQPMSPIRYLVLGILAVFSLGPLIIFGFSALKTQAGLASRPLGVPTNPQWDNFAEAFVQADMGIGLLNSAIIVGGTILGVCFIAGCAAYAMARLDLPGSGGVMAYLLVGSALPFQAFLVPLFFLWTRIGLYDTRLGLIIIYCAIFSPFATLLLRAFMLTIPRSYEEAARLDGASEWKVLFRVTLPLAWPGFLTIALVSGLMAYNEFLFAVTFIQTSSMMPVSTTFFSFQQGFTQNYALISAAGLIMVLPMLLIFLALQRRFVEGVTMTGIGG